MGDSYQASLEDAERNLPPEVGEVTPIHEWLVHRNPFMYALPGNFDVPDPDDE